MAGHSQAQLDRRKGKYRIKNIKGSAWALTQYGQYSFAVNEELDLLDDAVPGTLRAADYRTAKNMCGRADVGKPPKFTTYELAQRIDVGELSVIETVLPDLSVLREKPEG